MTIFAIFDIMTDAFLGVVKDHGLGLTLTADFAFKMNAYAKYAGAINPYGEFSGFVPAAEYYKGIANRSNAEYSKMDAVLSKL